MTVITIREKWSKDRPSRHRESGDKKKSPWEANGGRAGVGRRLTSALKEMMLRGNHLGTRYLRGED